MRNMRYFIIILCLMLPDAVVLAQADQSQRTYVIVHGAWGGVGSWVEVERLLGAHGHRVYLAELTGHGERAHLQSATVDLETHIRDVENLIKERKLTEIYLVGHSYGGMVITGVWDRVREHIKHIVYVDAFIPENGRSVLDYMIAEESRVNPGDIRTAAATTGFVIPVFARGNGFPPMQSARTFMQPLVLVNGPLPADTGRTYVRAVGNSAVESDPAFDQFSRAVKRDPAWRYLEVSTGHRVQVEDPHGLADILLALP